MKSSGFVQVCKERNYYKIINVAVGTWIGASNYCHSQGGELAIKKTRGPYDLININCYFLVFVSSVSSGFVQVC